MSSVSSIRAYERPELPLEQRLPSLARRFPCLDGAAGLDPWDPRALHAWIRERGEGSAAWHAGLLLLNLWGRRDWPRFDALAAARVWEEGDKQMFVDWMRVWRF
jgi:hypothetical protein